MEVYTEALEPTKSDPHLGILWSPSPGRVGCGNLTIRSKRRDTVYIVTEFPVGDGFDGRAFGFYKPEGEPGSDAEHTAYEVFVGRRGERLCDCKGFARWNHCKHVSAAEALIANGWVDHPLIPADLPELSDGGPFA